MGDSSQRASDGVKKASYSKDNADPSDSTKPEGYNFRDVAEADPSRLKPGLVFRSSQVFDLAALKARNVIVAVDLRYSSTRDRHRAKRGHDPAAPFSSAADAADNLKNIGRKLGSGSPTVAAGKDSLADLGIRTYSVAFLRPGAKLKLFWMAPRPAKWQVLRTVFTCGSAQEVMGPVVADPKQIGYGKLYCLILDTAKPFICHVLKILSYDGNLPLVIHCTHGKDRTGLIVALLLLLLGVEEAAVIKDYGISSSMLKEKREEMTSSGYIDEDLVGDEVITSSEGIMRHTLKHLHNRYNGIDGYLKEIGMTHDHIRDLRQQLLRLELLATAGT